MLTGQILLQGPSKEGLYPIKLPSSINKVCKHTALLGVIATSSIWHARLGHPLSKVIQLLKSQCSLPIKGSINHDVIRESCQAHLVSLVQAPCIESS